jgi:hypothetical protein
MNKKIRPCVNRMEENFEKCSIRFISSYIMENLTCILPGTCLSEALNNYFNDFIMIHINQQC